MLFVATKAIHFIFHSYAWGLNVLKKNFYGSPCKINLCEYVYIICCFDFCLNKSFGDDSPIMTAEIPLGLFGSSYSFNASYFDSKVGKVAFSLLALQSRHSGSIVCTQPKVKLEIKS